VLGEAGGRHEHGAGSQPHAIDAAADHHAALT